MPTDQRTNDVASTRLIRSPGPVLASQRLPATRPTLVARTAGAYVAAHPELTRPFHAVPHVKGVVGVAAQFARYLGTRMAADGVPRAAAGAGAGSEATATDPAAELAEVAS